jgi:hypothetical protein
VCVGERLGGHVIHGIVFALFDIVVGEGSERLCLEWLGLDEAS